MEFLRMERNITQIFRGKTTKDIAESFQDSDKEINTEGLDVTPSLNNLGKYDIDTNPRTQEPVGITLHAECNCGTASEIRLEPDYTGKITLDLEVNPVDDS